MTEKEKTLMIRSINALKEISRIARTMDPFFPERAIHQIQWTADMIVAERESDVV